MKTSISHNFSLEKVDSSTQADFDLSKFNEQTLTSFTNKNIVVSSNKSDLSLPD